MKSIIKLNCINQDLFMSKNNDKVADTLAGGPTRFARNKVAPNTNTNTKSIGSSVNQIKTENEGTGKTTPIGSNKALVFNKLLGGPGDSIIFQDMNLSRNPISNSNETPTKSPININNINNSLSNQPTQLARTRQGRNSIPLSNNKTLSSQQVKNEIAQQIEEKPNQKEEIKREGKKGSLTKQTQTNTGSEKKIQERVVDVTVQQREAIDLKIGDRGKKKIERKVQRTQRSNRGLKFVPQKTENSENTKNNDQTSNGQQNMENKFSKITVQPPATTQQSHLPNATPTNIASQSFQRQNRYQGRPKISSENAPNLQPSINTQQKQPNSIEVGKKESKRQLKQTPTVSTGTGPNKIEPLSLKANESLQDIQTVNQVPKLNESKEVEQKNNEYRYKSITDRPSMKGNRAEINQQTSNQVKSKILLTDRRMTNQPKGKQQQQKLIKPEELKVTLKKTSVAMLTVKRLMRNKLTDAFKIINTKSKDSKVHSVSEFTLFYCAINAITKNKQANLIKNSFQIIKRKFINVYVSELKSLGESHPPKNINAAVNFLDRLFFTKVRQTFKALTWKSEAYNRRAGPLMVLQKFSKKKQFQQLFVGFQKIRLRQLDKKHTLNQLANIVVKVHVNKLYGPFSKLILHSYKIQQSVQQNTEKKAVKAIQKPTPVTQVVAPDNQALVDKIEKLKATNSSNNEEISNLESKLKEKKNSYGHEKSSATENISTLKQQNQHLQTEIKSKKQLSQQFKQAIDSIQIKPQQEEQQDGEFSSESKLSLLTNIYISHYKNVEQTIQSAEITTNFNLKQQDSNLILSEWRSILQNTELKRIIASYEKVDPKSYKSRAILLEEQALTNKLIKSYIKEQYFWEWIHLSAQSN